MKLKSEIETTTFLTKHANTIQPEQHYFDI